MSTLRLSAVITGAPMNETTCSRRSISFLTRSMPGMMKFIPGSSVLRYRPNRSTLRARACGMIRTERSTVMTTSSATTAAIMTFSQVHGYSLG